MLASLVMITVSSDGGTQLSLSEYEPAPKIYPKCVLLIPSLVAPTKGIVILVKLMHHANAESPMLVTPSGMIMLVRLLQL